MYEVFADPFEGGSNHQKMYSSYCIVQTFLLAPQFSQTCGVDRAFVRASRLIDVGAVRAQPGSHRSSDIAEIARSSRAYYCVKLKILPL